MKYSRLWLPLTFTINAFVRSVVAFGPLREGNMKALVVLLFGSSVLAADLSIRKFGSNRIPHNLREAGIGKVLGRWGGNSRTFGIGVSPTNRVL